MPYFPIAQTAMVTAQNATKEWGMEMSLLLPLLHWRLLLLPTCRRDGRSLGLRLVVGRRRVGLLGGLG